MTTARAGRNAAIYLDDSSAGAGTAHAISLKNTWQISHSMDKYDVTAFNDTTKQYVPGTPDAAITFAGFWDADDNNTYNLIGTTTPRKCYIYPDRLNNATVYFFSTVYPDLTFEGSVDGPVTVSGSLSTASVAAWVHP